MKYVSQNVKMQRGWHYGASPHDVHCCEPEIDPSHPSPATLPRMLAGAIYAFETKLAIAGSMTRASDLTRNEGRERYMYQER